MAEESITIKDVVFVVDCGKAKATTYDALFATFMDIPNSCSAVCRERTGLAVCSQASATTCTHNVRNVVNFLKMIGALDENENLTYLGLSVRDPFLLPQDKKNLAGTAKSRFSAKDYSDHMALVRAYEGCRKRRISVRVLMEKFPLAPTSSKYPFSS
ncbi:hypothetical protein ACS0TY_002207 [Phlomoides rotata]